MQHLTPEEIGRLLDEQPTVEETGHLAACLDCAAELDAMRADREELRALAPPALPDHLWDAVEAKLRGEGLVQGRVPRPMSPAFRAAAGIAIFVLGSVAGGAAVSLRPAAGPVVTTESPANLVDATANLRAAEATYLQAVSSYSELANPAEAMDPLSRLAALEGILLTTGAALRESPADPVINNYHLTAMGMRDALVRQLGEAEQAAEEVEGEQWY